MIPLKQSTAAVVAVGTFVDIADGYTELTGLSTQAGRAIKNGVGSAFTAASWTHDANGTYLVGVSTSNTDTIGRLRLTFTDSATYLPVWENFIVIDADAYDDLMSTGGKTVYAVHGSEVVYTGVD